MDIAREDTMASNRFYQVLKPSPVSYLMGYGFIYAWGFCLWNSDIAGTAATGSIDQSAAWLVSAAVTPFVCALLVLWGLKRELPESKSLMLASGLSMSVGSLLVWFAPYSLDPTPLGVLMGIATGVGPALMIVLWTRLFARVDSELMESTLPLSFIITVVLGVIVPNLNAQVGLAVTVMLPLFSAFAFVCAHAALAQGAIPAFDAEQVANVKAGESVAKVMSIFLVVVAVELIVELLTYFSAGGPADAFSDWSGIVGVLLALMLSSAVVLYSRRVDIRSLYRAIAIPLIVAIAIVPFASSAVRDISQVIESMVSASIEVLIIVYFIRLSQRTSWSVTSCTGFGACASYLGIFVGGLLQFALPSIDPMLVTTVCLFCACAFAALSVLVPWGDDAGARLHSFAIAGVASSPVDNTNGVVSFDTACAQVAGAYGLSARETEVFSYLARGRSEPYIRDTLVLSRNTVSSHVRHIYQKLGIHSKQELIEMVERAQA